MTQKRKADKNPRSRNDAPVNPATDGRYLAVLLAAFVAVVAVVYFTMGGTDSDESTITGALDNRPVESGADDGEEPAGTAKQ